MAIINSDELAPGAVLRAAVGIIGGGPAGMTVALRLAEQGIDSVLCESGAEDYDDRVQQLYEGEASGYWDLTSTRLRQFGGSTNHFNGQSRPLDEIDFGEVSWRPGTRWPIDYAELTRYLPQAAELLGLVPGSWEASDWFDDLPAAPMEANGIVPVVFQARGYPFNLRHGTTLANASRCTVVQGVNATGVVVNDGGNWVERVDLVTLDGKGLTLEANRYVIATGGIESARLLLASTGGSDAGVGNSSDLVGRYFADHPASPVLPLVLPGVGEWQLPSRMQEGPFGDEVFVSAQLSITDEAQRARSLPGFHMRLASFPQPFPDDGPTAAVAALVAPLAVDTPYAGLVNIGFDTVPNPDSRVTLSSGRNELGEPTAKVDWRLSADDELLMQAVVLEVAAYLARVGAGRLDTRPPKGTWTDSVEGQHHHMGTLRMAASPRQGVVDPDLRFHDVGNLYAAGSAVFPTYGHVNPTLNIVALSLRLGDHLAREQA